MMDARYSRLVRIAQVLVLVGACTVAGAATAGSWQPVGLGDCPGRDVAGSRGPAPEAGKCDPGFVGYTAVCWANGCTYKKVATGSSSCVACTTVQQCPAGTRLCSLGFCEE